MSMQEVREQNIALVTQTALACFVENGIEKTTIRDIAQHAGLTERSVYRYFAGKDELVIAAAYLYWDRAKELAAQGITVENNAKMGATIADGLRQISRKLKPCADDTTVLFCFGGNDCDYNWKDISADPENPEEDQETRDIQITFHRETPKVGRNEPCPCGSGKKFKNCCGK